MKFLYQRDFFKRSKILGIKDALLDNFYILDLIFYLRNKFVRKVKISTPNFNLTCNCLTRDELFRAKRWLTKEPETIEWINTFETGSIFFDIGANVGMFSIYAAKAIEKIQVLSFEPLSVNYAKLNENIMANRTTQIKAYPIALNDNNTLSDLAVPNLSIAASGSQFGSYLDYLGKKFTPSFMQGGVGFSLDFLVSQGFLPCPNYIKIDVDGNEGPIVYGLIALLKDERLKSILIELSLGESATEERNKTSREVIEMIESNGFVLSRKAIVGSDLTNQNYIYRRR